MIKYSEFKQRLEEGKAEVDELFYFIINDGQLYRSRIKPIIANQKKKVMKGVFDPKLAIKIWNPLADDGAKAYVKEFGSAGDKWNTMFSVADRKEVAQKLMDYYDEEINESILEENMKARVTKALKTITANFSNATHQKILKKINSMLADPRYDPAKIRDADMKNLEAMYKDMGLKSKDLNTMRQILDPNWEVLESVEVNEQEVHNMFIESASSKSDALAMKHLEKMVDQKMNVNSLVASFSDLTKDAQETIKGTLTRYQKKNKLTGRMSTFAKLIGC